MLDVHPPHTPTHSWKDFFIHVGTICVGLLIAVGLEQTVEYLHRQQERTEMLHDIHAECETNIKTLAPAVAFYQQQQDWGEHAVTVLRTAPVVGGSITVTLPVLPPIPPPRAPSRAVWAVAKSSGKVALLPENLAEVFDRVDREAEQSLLAIDRTNSAETALDNFVVKTGIAPEPGATLHLTPSQRDELMDKLVTNIGDARSCLEWATWWEGASQAVLDGVTTRDDMDAYMDRARAAAFKNR